MNYFVNTTFQPTTVNPNDLFTDTETIAHPPTQKAAQRSIKDFQHNFKLNHSTVPGPYIKYTPVDDAYILDQLANNQTFKQIAIDLKRSLASVRSRYYNVLKKNNPPPTDIS